MVRSLRSREAKEAEPHQASPEPAPAEPAEPEVQPTAEVAKEEPKPAEVLVGHSEMDLVALGEDADKEQRAAEEKKLPCLSRCWVRLRRRSSRCWRSLVACWLRRLDAWESWLAAREQAALRRSFEGELRHLAADELPAPGVLELFGPSARTREKCRTLTFTEKEVLLAFTEVQLKRSFSLKARRQMLPRILGLTAVVLVSMGVFCLLAAIALAPTRSLTFNAGTILHDGTPASGAAAVSTRPLWDFPSLTLEQLRQVEDVLFEEKQRAHVLKIAAAAKLPDGSVTLTSADSTLRITAEGASYWSQGAAEVLLNDLEALRSLGASNHGGLFSAVQYQ